MSDFLQGWAFGSFCLILIIRVIHALSKSELNADFFFKFYTVAVLGILAAILSLGMKP